MARRLSRRRSSVADIHRNVGAYAAYVGLARPSYEQVRVVVNEARLSFAARRATRQLVFDVYVGRRPVSDLYQLLEE
jgi:hypothetical protein